MRGPGSLGGKHISLHQDIFESSKFSPKHISLIIEPTQMLKILTEDLRSIGC